MIPRSVLLVLLYVFFTLLIAFAVVMGGYVLAEAVEDFLFARVLRIIGLTCLLLLAVDGVLLVLVLAIRALGREERSAAPSERRPDQQSE